VGEICGLGSAEIPFPAGASFLADVLALSREFRYQTQEGSCPFRQVPLIYDREHTSISSAQKKLTALPAVRLFQQSHAQRDVYYMWRRIYACNKFKRDPLLADGVPFRSMPRFFGIRLKLLLPAKTVAATSLSEPHRPQSFCADAQDISRAPSPPVPSFWMAWITAWTQDRHI